MTRTGSLGAELTESQAALRVFLAAGGLVLVGLVLLLLTVWWWRGTKPEPPALGPLEVMSDRKWATTPESERRRLLETHRPEGAMVSIGHVPVPVDLSVLAREAPSSFDDLRDPVEAIEVAPADPEAAEIAALEGAGVDEMTDAPAEGDQPVADEVVAAGGDAGGEPVDGDGGDPASADPVDGDAVADGDAPVDGDEPVGVDELVGVDHSEAAHGGDADVEPADATVAMSRDETTAMPSPDQPYAPHPGA